MEIVKFKVRVIDNMLEIIPEGGIKDNSLYEIRLKNVESADGQTISKTVKIMSSLSPLYVGIQSVRALIDSIPITDDVILYHIREASKFAEYLKNGMAIDESNIPFEVSQFVRYRAAHDCLLSHIINMSSSTGISGKVADVSFSEKETTKDISKLLDHLDKEIKVWEDAVKGYKNPGRAKMKSVVRGGAKDPGFEPYGPTLNRGVKKNG